VLTEATALRLTVDTWAEDVNVARGVYNTYRTWANLNHLNDVIAKYNYWVETYNAFVSQFLIDTINQMDSMK